MAWFDTRKDRVTLEMVFSMETTTLAQSTDFPFGIGQLDEFLNLGSADPVSILISLINILLSLLGVLFLIMVLYSGLLFLFSGGRDERVSQAKKTFFNALVGILIIFLSFSIVQFLIDRLTEITSL